MTTGSSELSSRYLCRVYCSTFTKNLFSNICCSSLHNFKLQNLRPNFGNYFLGKNQHKYFFLQSYASLKLHTQRPDKLITNHICETKPWRQSDFCLIYMITDDNSDLKSKLMANDSFPPTYKQLVQCGCTRDVLDLKLCVQ